MVELKTELEKMYLDWVNNFLTIEKFAEHYNITEIEAVKIIELSRELLNNQGSDQK